MESKKEAIKALAREAAIQTQPELLEVGRKKKSLKIGIPREIGYQENRIALVPEAVQLLVNNGHEVMVETKAGEKSCFEDHEFSEAGAQIAYSSEQVFECDIIFKVAPPSLEEIDMMPGKQTLFSAFQVGMHPVETIKKLMEKKVKAIAWDYIEDESGVFPVVRSMGEIAGNTSILIAAELLCNATGGMGMMLGGISGVKPTQVVVLGAGAVGEFATRAALGLGADVKLFDNSIYKLRRVQYDLGSRLWTSVLQPEELRRVLKDADVVIGALNSPYGRTPCVVTEDMVEQMKPGSVIVDVAIDKGGCIETSNLTNHKEPTFNRHGVIHYCVPNIASRVSRTASYALSNIFTPILMDIGEEGRLTELMRKRHGLRQGMYLYNGILTNEIIGEAFGIPYKSLDLILATF